MNAIGLYNTLRKIEWRRIAIALSAFFSGWLMAKAVGMWKRLKED